MGSSIDDPTIPELDERISKLEDTILTNSAPSSNLFDFCDCHPLKGKVAISLTDNGFILKSTASTKYDGVYFQINDLEPSTKYTVQFGVPSLDDSNKGNIRFGYTNAKGALVGADITTAGKYSYSFTTGPEQNSTKLNFHLAYKNSIPAGNTIEYTSVMLTKGDIKFDYIPILTFKDEKCRHELEFVKDTIVSVKEDSSKTLSELENFKTTISDIFVRRNEVSDIETELYSISNGIVTITPKEEKKRQSILSNHKVKHDGYVEYIGGGFYSPNCRYGNGIQINAVSNDNIIEDCVVHDCFDTGVTIQQNDVSYRNTIRRCKSYNCFWNFEAYWGNDVTFIDCVAYNSKDMSNGYRGVNASTRNALYLVWAAGKLDNTIATRFIRCYGAYSTGDGIYVGSNVNYVIKDCKVYGTAKKSKNVLDTILKYEGNEVKYVEAIAIGNLITQK